MKYFFCVACLPACLKPLFAFSLKMENRFIGERQPTVNAFVTQIRQLISIT
jgi:hypothetical protein